MPKDRSFVIIGSFVLFMHGLLLFFAYDRQFLKKFEAAKPVQRLMVQTISLGASSVRSGTGAPRDLEAQPLIARTEQSEVETPEAPLEEEVPPPKATHPVKKSPIKKEKPKQKAPKQKSLKKETSKKKEVKAKKTDKVVKNAKKKPPVEKKINENQKIAVKRQQKLLGKAQESIAKIGQKRDKSPSHPSIEALPDAPGLISALQIDTEIEQGAGQLSDQETNYRQELASRLKLVLRLPEYGEVRLKLTLENTGKVAKLLVLSAESIANRSYIEKTLPSLKFPKFGPFNEGNEYTFSITLSNE